MTNRTIKTSPSLTPSKDGVSADLSVDTGLRRYERNGGGVRRVLRLLPVAAVLGLAGPTSAFASEAAADFGNNMQSTGKSLGADILALKPMPSEIKDCLFVSGEAFKMMREKSASGQYSDLDVSTRMMITFAWSNVYNSVQVTDWDKVSAPLEEMSKGVGQIEVDYTEAFETRLRVCDGFVNQAFAARTMANEATK